MKNKISMGVVFLITYIGFLIATLPTTWVLNQFSLPNNIGISGVTGNIWNTNIAQVTVEGNRVEKMNAKLSVWSLFTLAPKVSITFGDSFTAGSEGKLELVLSSGKAVVNDFTLLIKANDIAQQLTLPLPVTAQGDVALTLAHAEIDLAKNNQCITASGTVNWSKAGIVALDQNVKLGQFAADINCEKGALVVKVSPKNDLGLTFNAFIRQGGKLSGNGFLKPGAKFPQTLNDALPFLGKKDRQGRYRLSF